METDEKRKYYFRVAISILLPLLVVVGWYLCIYKNLLENKNSAITSLSKAEKNLYEETLTNKELQKEIKLLNEKIVNINANIDEHNIKNSSTMYNVYNMSNKTDLLLLEWKTKEQNKSDNKEEEKIITYVKIFGNWEDILDFFALLKTNKILNIENLLIKNKSEDNEKLTVEFDIVFYKISKIENEA